MNRQDMIDAMEWLSPDSGSGFGVCEIASMFSWAMAEPGPEGDLKSVVAVKGPSEKYSDEDIAKLHDFSQRYTAYYDEMFTQRMGANLIIVDNDGYDPSPWMAKGMSWTMGRFYWPTLEEALASFERNLREE